MQTSNSMRKLRRAVAPLLQPHLLPYARIENSSKPHSVMVTRQWVHTTLRDRLQKKQGLLEIETRFLLYQMLAALHEAHSNGITHGDIKPENVLITSYGWVLIADWALHKPVELQADNPASFYYFFAPQASPSCRLAPERLVEKPRRGAAGSISSTPGHGARKSFGGSTAEDGTASESSKGRTASALQSEDGQGADTEEAPLLDAAHLVSVAASQDVHKLRELDEALGLDPSRGSSSAGDRPRGSELRCKADIFAMGCTAAELLGGPHAFGGMDLPAMLQYRRGHVPGALVDVLRAVPPDAMAEPAAEGALGPDRGSSAS